MRAESCEATVVIAGAPQLCDRPLDHHGYCDRPSAHVWAPEGGLR